MNNFDEMILKIAPRQILTVDLELTNIGYVDQEKIDSCVAKLKKADFTIERQTEYTGTNQTGQWRKIMIHARKKEPSNECVNETDLTI